MSVPFIAAKNGSSIRSTPVTGGESLLVAGMRDVLVCLDVATGAERWRVVFPRLGHERPAFGFESSPLVADDTVFVQAGGSLRLIAAEPGHYEVLGEMDLVEGPSWAHLAVVSGASGTELHVREPPTGSSAGTPEDSPDLRADTRRPGATAAAAVASTACIRGCPAGDQTLVTARDLPRTKAP